MLAKFILCWPDILEYLTYNCDKCLPVEKDQGPQIKQTDLEVKIQIFSTNNNLMSNIITYSYQLSIPLS